MILAGFTSTTCGALTRTPVAVEQDDFRLALEPWLVGAVVVELPQERLDAAVGDQALRLPGLGILSENAEAAARAGARPAREAGSCRERWRGEIREYLCALLKRFYADFAVFRFVSHCF